MILPEIEGHDSGSQITVCSLVENTLASEYVTEMLAREVNIQSINLDALLGSGSNGFSRIIFLLDISDLCLPVRESIRLLKQKFPQAKYLLLVGTAPKENAYMIAALGGDGLICRENVRSFLVEAVRVIADGGTWFSSEITKGFYTAARNHSQRHAGIGPQLLTTRECEVVHLVRHRLTNKEIAQLLRIEEVTVKFHLSKIFGKLDVTSRDELFDKRTIDSAREYLVSFGGNKFRPEGNEYDRRRHPAGGVRRNRTSGQE